MEQRTLGASGIKIAPFVLGTNVFGWTADERTSFAVLDRFTAEGFNCIDTADVYSFWAPGHTGGESETIIGRWMKARGSRGKIILATKVGMPMGPDKKGLSAAYIRQAAEASLKRLQTDYIDLYQSHADDEATPFEETLETYERLIKAGMVRAIGASNYGGARLKAAVEASERKRLPRYSTLQPLYNLYDRAGFEKDLASVCAEKGLGVIPYFSLACGFLTGKYRSEADLAGRARSYRVKSYLTPRGFRILDALDAVARRLKASPAQVSLAWLCAQPTIVAPIASATSVEQLDEILGFVRVKLDREAMSQLNEASRDEGA
jgi:aryl-alcohol dehydrogenase-like predicted oxidoreductase